jgi:hypothetical protein
VVRQAKFADGWGFGFKLEPIFATDHSSLKNEAYFGSGQKSIKNNRLANNNLNP